MRELVFKRNLDNETAMNETFANYSTIVIKVGATDINQLIKILYKLLVHNVGYKRKKLKIEITVPDSYEVTKLRFLVPFIRFRKNISDEYRFILSKIKSDQYYRLNALFSGIKRIYNIRMYAQDREGNSLPISNNINKDFNRIVPIIEIDDDVNTLLKIPVEDVSDNHFSGSVSKQIIKTVFKNLYDELIYEKDLVTSNANDSQINETVFDALNKANLLTFLIYGLIYKDVYHSIEIEKAAQETKLDRNALRSESLVFRRVYERANAYASGVLQLIENVQMYTEKGFLVFRALSIGNSELKRRVEGNKALAGTQSALQIMIFDLAKVSIEKEEPFVHNMVDVFLRNVNKQRRSAAEELEGLQLRDLFNPKQDSGMWKYLQNSDNIAMHYGLQILDFAISAANGEFYVETGDENNSLCYSSAYEQTEYNEDAGEYYCGTSYDILLPIQDILDEESVGALPFPDDVSYAAVEILHDPIKIEPSTKNIVLQTNKIDIEIRKSNDIEKLKLAIAKAIPQRWAGDIPLQICLSSEKTMSLYNLEILAKAVFKVLADRSESCKNCTQMNVAITGFFALSEILEFARFFSKFYNRIGHNNALNKTQLLLAVRTGESFIFSGKNLASLYYNYQTLSNNVTGLEWKQTISEMFTNVCKRDLGFVGEIFEESRKITPHVFDRVKCDGINERWFMCLKNVLGTDIHLGGTRVCDDTTHIQVSGVHLDTFYYADSLLGSAYWSEMFAKWLAKEIASLSLAKEEQFVLVGYDSLLESTMSKTARILDCDYLIYENGKYEMPNVPTEERIRGKDRVKKSGLLVPVIIMGISSTLSTYKSIYEKLKSELDMSNKVFAYSLVQSIDEQALSDTPNNTFLFNKLCELNTDVEKNNIIKSKVGYLDFAKNEYCQFLIAMHAKWYDSKKCPLCYPEKKDDFERAIFKTDDTSLVPVFLLRETGKKNKKAIIENEEKNLNFFIKNNSGEYIYQDCLYYAHAHRGDSHFQYYIRTAKLFEEVMRDNGERMHFNDQTAKISSRIDRAKITVILAPQHFSNEKFPDYINNAIFGDNAHIIRFDPQKTFRSNFKIEFQRYSSVISDIVRAIKRDEIDCNKIEELLRKEIQFVYVDDQINTGAGFYRAKSLAESLFKDANINVKAVFSYIFVLTDRHSLSSRTSYIFDAKNRFFSYFDFYVPHIRTQGDSCPICKKLIEYSNLSKRAAMNHTSYICFEKQLYHRIKSIGDVRKAFQKKSRKNIKRHMMRFEIENALQAELSTVFQNNEKLSINHVTKQIESFVSNFCENVDGTQRIEIVISALKALSRPFLTYNPMIATAAIAYIKRLLNSFFNITKNKLSIRLCTEIDLDVSKEGKSLLVCLINGLRDLNSTFLLDCDVLEKIIRTYAKLCNKTKLDNVKMSEFENMSFMDYLLFAVFQLVRVSAFGDGRRKRFESIISKRLEHLIENSIGRNNDVLIEFYSYVYLECGKRVDDKTRLYEVEDKEKKEEIDRKESIINKTLDCLIKDVFQYNIQKRNKSGVSIESAMQKCNSNEEIFDGLLFYYDENDYGQKEAEERIVLQPITSNARKDAYDIGYRLHFQNERCAFHQLDTVMDENGDFLSDRLTLNNCTSNILSKYGVSLFCSACFPCANKRQTLCDHVNNQNSLCKFIFLKIGNNYYDYKNSKIGLSGVPEMKPLYVRMERGNSLISTLKKIRSILNHRTVILEKIKEYMTKDNLKALVYEQRRVDAIQVAKGTAHGGNTLERIAEKKKYINDAIGIDALYQIMDAEKRRLLANRFIAETYRAERIVAEAPYDNQEHRMEFLDDDSDTYVDTPSSEYLKMLLSGVKLGIGVLDGKPEVDLRINKSLNGQNYYVAQHIGSEVIENPLIDIMILLAYNARRHYIETGNAKLINTRVFVENAYLVVKADTGITEKDGENGAIAIKRKALRSIAIPPEIREKEARFRQDEKPGITLWTLSRYAKRLNKNTSTQIFPYTDDKPVGYDFFNINLEKQKNQSDYKFTVKIKCIKQVSKNGIK